MRRIRDRSSERGTQDATELAERVREMAYPLRETGDLDPLLNRIGDARCVLLGEASHGTSEYYTWRARISERLVREKGFSFIAVEGDWPDCYEMNRYVKGYPDSGTRAREVLKTLPVANLDVGQRGNRRSPRAAAAAQRRASGGEEGGLLRAGRLQLMGVDGGGDRAPRARRPGGGSRRAARLQMLRAVWRGRPGVRAGDGVGPDLVRGRGRGDALGAARQASGVPG